MADRHVVVDGSNLATEGRSMPSLAQLDQAVREFLLENPDDMVTVVVDASFGHRIDPSESQVFEEAEAAGELVSPPAGAIGRGDAFLLRIADKTGATVLSNDSFQEFHGDYEWLFERGRLIGGKPVPGVGWIFTPRTPVRGPRSREAVKEAKRKTTKSDSESAVPGLDLAAERSRTRGTKGKGKVERAIAVALEEAVAPKDKPGRHRKSASPPADPVNDPLTFITFIAAHPLGGEVVATVESFASHGAFVDCEGARCYLPLSAMGDPAPKSAREIFSKGEQVRFVVQALDPQRRGVELAMPGFAKIAGAPTEETVAAEIEAQAAEEAATAAAAAPPARRTRKKAAASIAVVEVVAPAPAPAKKAPARRRGSVLEVAATPPVEVPAKKAPTRRRGSVVELVAPAPAEVAVKKAPARRRGSVVEGVAPTAVEGMGKGAAAARGGTRATPPEPAAAPQPVPDEVVKKAPARRRAAATPPAPGEEAVPAAARRVAAADLSTAPRTARPRKATPKPLASAPPPESEAVPAPPRRRSVVAKAPIAETPAPPAPAAEASAPPAEAPGGVSGSGRKRATPKAPAAEASAPPAEAPGGVSGSGRKRATPKAPAVVASVPPTGVSGSGRKRGTSGSPATVASAPPAAEAGPVSGGSRRRGTPTAPVAGTSAPPAEAPGPVTGSSRRRATPTAPAVEMPVPPAEGAGAATGGSRRRGTAKAPAETTAAASAPRRRRVPAPEVADVPAAPAEAVSGDGGEFPPARRNPARKAAARPRL